MPPLGAAPGCEWYGSRTSLPWSTASHTLSLPPPLPSPSPVLRWVEFVLTVLLLLPISASLRYQYVVPRSFPAARTVKLQQRYLQLITPQYPPYYGPPSAAAAGGPGMPYSAAGPGGGGAPAMLGPPPGMPLPPGSGAPGMGCPPPPPPPGGSLAAPSPMLPPRRGPSEAGGMVLPSPGGMGMGMPYGGNPMPYGMGADEYGRQGKRQHTDPSVRPALSLDVLPPARGECCRALPCAVAAVDLRLRFSTLRPCA